MNLGKFQIIEEIGHGGFGTVYRANDTTLDRIIALKVLHQQYLADQKFIESFKREARMMAKVSHPNVVQIFEVGDLDGQIYIAMQYFDGGNLDQKIQVGGPLPLRDAIRMLSQTARGLEAGHKIGLVHRDVKPANILYNRDGYIAISDFGVAKSIQQSSHETTNSFNQFAGTPYYIPPELWKSEGNPSPSADVYSLACVFYEALTGKILFAGDTYEHVLTRHVLEMPAFSQALPECLADTLIIALAKNPSDRYQTMHDFLAAIRGALERQPRKSVGTNTTQEQTNLVEGLPKPLAPGEITFDELVRRSQRKTTAQSPVTKPAPISQPTPAPLRPMVPKEQPQIQKTEPKREPPAIVPIIRPPQIKEQPSEPIVEESPSSEAPTTEPEVSLPEMAAGAREGSDAEGFSEDESVEDFFARTSEEPIETEELEQQKAAEITPPAEQPDDEMILEDWLTKETTANAPALVETPVTDGGEDAPPTMEDGVLTEEDSSDEVTKEAAQILLVEEIVDEKVVETPDKTEEPTTEEDRFAEEIEIAAKEIEGPAAGEEIISEEIEGTLEEFEEPAAVTEIVSEAVNKTPTDSEQITPVEQSGIDAADEVDFKVDQSQPPQEAPAIPALQTQEQSEVAEDAVPEDSTEEAVVAAASASHMMIAENELEDEVMIVPASEMPQEAQSVAPTEDRLTQTLKEREGLLVHNAATSKFDQSQKIETERETKKEFKFILLLAFGGMAVIALAFLALSGQARSLFGGKPSNTPTFTLTLLPSNTAAAPVIILTRTSTSTTVASSTSTNTQTSAAAASQTPAPTTAATSTVYPTTRPTDRPINPPNPPTARPTDRPTNPPNPPTATTAPPTKTPVPPTYTPVLPTYTPVPPINTPVLPTYTPVLPTYTPVPPTATLPPSNTPVPTRGPTSTPP